MTRLEMEMFPTALVLPRSRAEEAAAQAALLECAGGFSPRVEDQSSDGYFTCVIDIAGTETLFGSPDTLGESLLKRTQALGIRASIAISSNFMQPGALHEGTHRQMAVYGWCRVEWNALRSLLYHSMFSIFLRNMRKHSPCGASPRWSIGEAGGNRVDCSARTTGQRTAPAGTRRIAAFIYRDRASLTLEERIKLDSPVELLDSLLLLWV